MFFFSNLLIYILQAYMDSFSQSLNYECQSTGVTVQTLTPGYVNTQMVSYNAELRAGGILVPSPAVFAKNAILTLGVASKTTGYWSHGIEVSSTHRHINY